MQRELPGNLVFSLAYVGAKGTYVDVVGLNINQAIPGPGAVVSRRPYPNLSDATGVVPWANEMYQSMQTTFERRLGAVRFSGSWTWAHSIDESSGESSGSPIQNPYNLAGQRASSTFDVRHKVSVRMDLGDALRPRQAFPHGRAQARGLDRRRLAVEQHRDIPDRTSIHPNSPDQHAERWRRVAVPHPPVFGRTVFW